MTYGDTIRAARKARGKTIAELAHAAGVSMLHLWGVETNRHRPSAALVVRLARALDVDPLAALEASGALDRPAPVRRRAGRRSAPETPRRKPRSRTGG